MQNDENYIYKKSVSEKYQQFFKKVDSLLLITCVIAVAVLVIR